VRLEDLFRDQRDFSKLLDHGDSLTQEDIDSLTKNLALALYSEVGELVSATDYKSHRSENICHNPDKILFESVDVVRYIIAILNLWNISPEMFMSAWSSKDRYLMLSKQSESNKWHGEKVAIIDVDDVIAEFRECFSGWLYKAHNVVTDVKSQEYYFIDALESSGLNPEDVFSEFIQSDGFLNIRPADGAREFMTSLKDMGYFVHILTARPRSSLRCYYNTFEWLDKNKIPFDKIDFASEKLRWCMQSEYWTAGAISFAVDDSPKHASEYSKHGIRTFVPRKSYNTEMSGKKNCVMFEGFRSCLEKLSKVKKHLK